MPDAFERLNNEDIEGHNNKHWRVFFSAVAYSFNNSVI